MKMRLVVLTLTLALTAISAGCMKMGPDYARPDLPKAAETYQHADKAAGMFDPDERWWVTYGDPELNRLVDKALAYNLDLKKAAARVLELQANLTQTDSQLYPSLNLSGDAKREQTVESPLLDRRKEAYSLSAAASYEVDLWGKISRASEAARADLLQAEENRRTVAHTLIASVVTSYLNQEALERRLMVSTSSIKAASDSLVLVESRYSRGLTSILDVTQSRRTLAQALAVKPELRRQLANAQMSLAVLLGSYPRSRKARIQPDDYFPNLGPVPAGLPSELLKRRPDILAAEAAVIAANARVGQALAARFPSIKLTGAYGYATDALGSLFNPASELWNLAAGLTQPLFDAGRLKAGQEAAEARFQQSAADYAKTVLEAFKEVEEALMTRKELSLRRSHLQEAVREAIATHQTADERYARGLADYLQVLDAIRTRYDLEDQLVQVELALLTNRVTLHRALGGAWDLNTPIQKADL